MAKQSRYTISLAALIGLREAKHDQNLPTGSVILNAYHRQHTRLPSPPSHPVRPESNGSIGEIKVGVTATINTAEATLIKNGAADLGYPTTSAYVNALLLADLNINPASLRVTTTPPPADV